MSWRERLRPASFRGVPFKLDEIQAEDGRRIVEHVFPLRDQAFVEDLGRAVRRITVVGYVLGEDYDRARDALIDALAKPGAGPLVLPTRGEVQVAAGDVTWRESRTEGGVCRFEMAFVVAEGAPSPTARADTRAAVEVAAADVEVSAGGDFARAWDVLRRADSVAAGARGVVGALRVALALRRFLPADAAAALEYADLLARLGADLSASGVRGDATGLFDAGRRAAGPSGTEALYRDLRGFDAGLPPVAPRTPTRRVEAGNRAAFAALADRLSLAARARAASSASPASRTDARRLRDRLAADMDAAALAAGDAGDDASYRALTSLRAATVRDLTDRGAALPDLAPYASPRPRPALALSQRLYGEGGRADELAARNRAPHPLFMPPDGEYLL